MNNYFQTISSSFAKVENQDTQYKIDYWLLIFSILLWRFPISLGLRNDLLFRILFLFPFIIQIIIKFIYLNINKPPFLIDKKFLVVFLLYVAIWVVGFIRTISYYSTNSPSSNLDSFSLTAYLLTLIILCGFFFLLLACHTDNKKRKRLLQAIFYTFELYIAINFILFIFGIKSIELTYLTNYPAQMLSALGISLNRTMFSMAGGINSFGILPGAIMVGLFPLLISRRDLFSRIFLILVILIGMSVILLTDSRGSLIFSIITLVLMYIPPELFKIFRWSPILISFLPVFVLIVFPFLLDPRIDLFIRPRSEGNERNTSAMITTECKDYLKQTRGFLSNRPFIWEMIIDDLHDFKITQIIGYGIRGQVVSGLSNSYSCLFSSFVRPTLASAHNSWLEIFLDYGYFGLVIILIFLITVIRKLSKFYEETKDELYKGMLACILYITLTGTLESSFSQDFYGIFIILLFISISLLFKTSPGKIEPEDSNYPLGTSLQSKFSNLARL